MIIEIYCSGTTHTERIELTENGLGDNSEETLSKVQLLKGILKILEEGMRE